LRPWTSYEVSILKEASAKKTDRQIAISLRRPLESVRSQRHRLLGPRWASPMRRWDGSAGLALERKLVDEYRAGASQESLVVKYHVEWSKLGQVLRSHAIPIRNKTQQAFVGKYGRLPRIVSRLSDSKLYIIFAMFGDGLRPSTQARRATHIIGIAAGKDRDFADKWISSFEQEYSVRPSLKVYGKNNIQASISSVDIWNDLHRYAIFGTRAWKFHDSTFQHLMSNKVSSSTLGQGLKGYFDADGSVKYQVKRASRQVNVSSVNPIGLNQVSLLLRKMGLPHGVYEESIAIFGRRNLVDYQRKIGFSIGRKNEALINMISTFHTK